MLQVNLTAASGEMGILANHVPSIEQLKPGVLEVIENGQNEGKKWFGVLHIVYLGAEPGPSRLKRRPLVMPAHTSGSFHLEGLAQVLVFKKVMLTTGFKQCDQYPAATPTCTLLASSPSTPSRLTLCLTSLLKYGSFPAL